MSEDLKVQNEEQVIEVSDTQDVEKEVEEIAVDLEGLTTEEVDMFNEQKEGDEEDGEHKEQLEVKTEEVEEKEEVKEPETKPITFDDVEKDESNMEKFNANEKALYWKWKSDKRKRQDAVKELEDFKVKGELNTVKDLANGKKLSKIKEALSGEVTIEVLQEILGEGIESSDAPLTKADLEKFDKEKEEKVSQSKSEEKARLERIDIANKIGLSKYKEFEDIANLANEVVVNDKSGTYREILDAAFNDKNIEESDIVDKVVTIAKLSDKFNEITNPVSKESKEKADRMIKNSKKKKSSASVSGGSGKRTINVNEITVAQAAQLSPTEYGKLPDKVRKRLLMGIDP